MSDGDRRWSQRYPPLLGGLVATALAAFVLPSALNVPQSNPSQTLEFAPVPPEDDIPPPPPSGNSASLGLGSSAGPTDPGGATGGPPDVPPPPLPEGQGTRPVTKRCVGDPPRQTEDPMSPPCVAHFEGDNGGATYEGVDANEIDFLVYSDGDIINITSRGTEYQCEHGRHYDLGEPAQDDEPADVRGLRVFQHYFNERFQTYDRTLRIHLYCAAHPGDDQYISPEERRADAANLVGLVDPFAYVTQISWGSTDAFVDQMAGAGRVHFSVLQNQAEHYRRHPGLLWSYRPSLEIQVAQFASYVCSKVAAHPVSFSGNDDHGASRVLGLLFTDHEGAGSLTRFAELAREEIEACGVEFAHVARFANYGSVYSGSPNTEAIENVAAFQDAGVTTIVWAQGFDAEHSKAAAQLGYEPEWVVAGDGAHDGYAPQTHQDQEVWEHAWVVTIQPLQTGSVFETRCAQVLSEHGDLGRQDISHLCTFRNYYTQLRQLFTGIQVAGPKLTPQTMDRGFHAIPPVPSTDPQVPASYYDPGDYTCVKDATAGWWDPEGPNSLGTGAASNSGCWRMAEGGRRYLVDGWPDGDVTAQQAPDDPCNQYSGQFFLYRDH